MKRISLLATLLISAVASPAALAAAADAVTVVDPYVRQVPPGARATAAFMVLRNTGDKDVKLVKATNTASNITELHTHINEGGVMKMRPVPAIQIKAGGETVLEPGGLHVMLIDMKKPMKEGDKVALTLGFDDGSTKEIEVPVRRPVPGK